MAEGKKILVIEDDARVVNLMLYPLESEGYTVTCVPDGPEGLVAVARSKPDLIITAFSLPSMKGSSLARRLRKDPMTSNIRIMLIADEDQLEELEIGPSSAVDDFLIKPFGASELLAKVSPLVVSEEEIEGAIITTGNTQLDDKLGGGIPLGSLTLIEGTSGAGKSVLSQQMMHGSLEHGYRLALFTSENTVSSLVKQMESLGLDIMPYLLLGKFKIYPIEVSQLGKEAPPTLIRAIKNEADCDMVFVDSLTSAIPSSSDREVLGFFEESKRICGSGTTIIAIVHSHGLSRELLTRIRSLCDAHLRLHTEEVGNRLVKTLEATKVRGADKTTGNIVSFEVEPGWGIKIIPISKVRG